MGVGLNKVWILYRADGKVFERRQAGIPMQSNARPYRIFLCSYRKAVDCVSDYGIDIELVEDRAGEFGRNLASVLKEKCMSKLVYVIQIFLAHSFISGILYWLSMR